MKLKTVYVCTECGAQSSKWLGKCPHCGRWNTLVEEVIDTQPETAAKVPKRTSMAAVPGENKAAKFGDMTLPAYIRTDTGLSELDRVLGGGLVTGSVVLLSGEPGIGKSTLLMQISDALGQNRKVLYVSGEESGGQLKLRAKRLGVTGEHLYILTETNLENILAETNEVRPDVMILDSIQTIYSDKVNSAPGSITQVRECALTFINKAKSEGISMLLVGHVNKEGGLAGPKVLEHMVDAVLYFEGERQQAYRIIRAVKNRYGSVSEIGVFEMTDRGLEEVANPSEMLLSGRPKNVSGNCALCTIEGTRPLIAEVQALVSPTVFPAPRRTGNGVEYNRMCLILAVLEKRLGLKFYQNDVYMNVIGGLSIGEPAADLAIATALVSSLTDRVVPDDLIVIGELGLAGECRAVSNPEMRVREAARLGFKRAIVPFRNVEKRPIEVEGMKIIPVRSVYEVIKELKGIE